MFSTFNLLYAFIFRSASNTHIYTVLRSVFLTRLALVSLLCPAVAGPSTSLTTMSLLAKNTPSRSEMTKVQQQVKVNGASVAALRREMQEVRVKQLEQQKQLQDQEQKLQEQSQVIGEQNARLAELEHKLRELMDSAVGGSSSSSTPAPAVSSSSGAGPASAEGGLCLKRPRKCSDLPRHSKRLRSKK